MLSKSSAGDRRRMRAAVSIVAVGSSRTGRPWTSAQDIRVTGMTPLPERPALGSRDERDDLDGARAPPFVATSQPVLTYGSGAGQREAVRYATIGMSSGRRVWPGACPDDRTATMTHAARIDDDRSRRFRRAWAVHSHRFLQPPRDRPASTVLALERSCSRPQEHRHCDWRGAVRIRTPELKCVPSGMVRRLRIPSARILPIPCLATSHRVRSGQPESPPPFCAKTHRRLPGASSKCARPPPSTREEADMDPPAQRHLAQPGDVWCRVGHVSSRKV